MSRFLPLTLRLCHSTTTISALSHLSTLPQPSTFHFRQDHGSRKRYKEIVLMFCCRCAPPKRRPVNQSRSFPAIDMFYIWSTLKYVGRKAFEKLTSGRPLNSFPLIHHHIIPCQLSWLVLFLIRTISLSATHFAAWYFLFHGQTLFWGPIKLQYPVGYLSGCSRADILQLETSTSCWKQSGWSTVDRHHLIITLWTRYRFLVVSRRPRGIKNYRYRGKMTLIQVHETRNPPMQLQAMEHQEMRTFTLPPQETMTVVCVVDAEDLLP
jgi:hypothetical protein